jgi:CubicO group peptidase (beta-lactamase class C family)
VLDGLTLPELMQRLHVPGLSIAVIRDFKIHWVKAYGVANVESGRPVETNTMFQAASISKPVTAMAAMRLVDEHRLSLDDDINTILKSWHAPGHGVNAAFADEPHLGRRRWVWISGIRSVRAKAHRGSDPGREGALERGCGALFARPPYQAYKYSGGGVTIMQLALVDLIGRPFAEFMRSTVLEPLGDAGQFVRTAVAPSARQPGRQGA